MDREYIVSQTLKIRKVIILWFFNFFFIICTDVFWSASSQYFEITEIKSIIPIILSLFFFVSISLIIPISVNVSSDYFKMKGKIHFSLKRLLTPIMFFILTVILAMFYMSPNVLKITLTPIDLIMFEYYIQSANLILAALCSSMICCTYFLFINFRTHHHFIESYYTEKYVQLRVKLERLESTITDEYITSVIDYLLQNRHLVELYKLYGGTTGGIASSFEEFIKKVGVSHFVLILEFQDKLLEGLFDRLKRKINDIVLINHILWGHYSLLVRIFSEDIIKNLEESNEVVKQFRKTVGLLERVDNFIVEHIQELRQQAKSLSIREYEIEKLFTFYPYIIYRISESSIRAGKAILVQILFEKLQKICSKPDERKDFIEEKIQILTKKCINFTFESEADEKFIQKFKLKFSQQYRQQLELQRKTIEEINKLGREVKV
ncbi:MAG: hypothetical protein ACXADY_13900 [Candidatus Hodarchaeales archaeon]